MTLPHFKESVMGSVDIQRKQGTCYHDWEPKHGLLFGYMEVFAQCEVCKTWWSPPRGMTWDESPGVLGV